MPESDVATEPATAERRLFGKHKWRGKFFTSEERGPKSPGIIDPSTDDLVEFLAPSNSRKTRNASDQHVPHPRTSRSPSASAADRDSAENLNHQKRRPPRRQGLRVTFESAAPEIIGEGGDESDIPSIDVTKSRARATAWSHSQEAVSKQPTRRSSPPPQVEVAPRQDSALASRDVRTFEPPRLQRRSTGFHDVQQGDSETGEHDETNVRDSNVSTTIRRESPLSSPGSNGDSETFAASYAEYTQRPPESPRKLVDEPSPRAVKDRLAHKREIGDLRGSSLKPFSPDFGSSVSNSITPIPSPQPPIFRRAPPSGYGFPVMVHRGEADAPSEANDERDHTTTRSDNREINTPAVNPTIISPPLPSPSKCDLPLKAPLMLQMKLLH